MESENSNTCENITQLSNQESLSNFDNCDPTSTLEESKNVIVMEEDARSGFESTKTSLDCDNSAAPKNETTIDPTTSTALEKEGNEEKNDTFKNKIIGNDNKIEEKKNTIQKGKSVIEINFKSVQESLGPLHSERDMTEETQSNDEREVVLNENIGEPSPDAPKEQVLDAESISKEASPPLSDSKNNVNIETASVDEETNLSLALTIEDSKTGLSSEETSVDGDSKSGISHSECKAKDDIGKRMVVPKILEEEKARTSFEDPKLPIDEDSVSSNISQKSVKRKWTEDDSNMTSTTLPAENLHEYIWPTDETGEYYMIQEQVSEFLGVKSFKRKYPEIFRRVVEKEEREYLRERFSLSEMLFDLGLTAVKSDDVVEMMVKEYPEKHQEFARVFQERESQKKLAARKTYNAPTVIDKAKMTEFLKKTAQAAAEYNSRLNQERRDERRCCIDLQTHTVNFPSGKFSRSKIQKTTSNSKYPLTLIPGQFQDYYRKYTPNELRYLPIGTVVFGPPSKISQTQSASIGSEDSLTESDDSSSSDESSSSQDSHGESNISTASTESNKKSFNENKKPSPDAVQCRVCHKWEVENSLIQCSECKRRGHSKCLDLSEAMIEIIKTYPWQCMECKTCVHCRDPYDEDKMMFCDKCDRGYHTFCVGVRNIPSGRWICKSCGQCSVCGIRAPGPEGSARAQWQNEYGRNKNGQMEIIRTLCITCAKPGRKSRANTQAVPVE